jgi:hypothetical protein
VTLWRRTVAGATLAAWVVGGAGTLLIVGWLAWMVAVRTQAPGLDQARIELRRKNLAELRAENHAALTTYGWVDPVKGLVRLPVTRAMELTLELWKDPAAGRSNLLTRLDKATAKPPEKPNVYE